MEREKIISILKNDGLRLLFFRSFSDDYNIVYTAVKNNGDALCMASERLRDNIFLACLSLETSPRGTYKCTDRVLKSKEYVLHALKKGYYVSLLNLDHYIINDFEIISLSIKLNPNYISYASEEIKDNTEIAKLCLSKMGKCLKYFSKRIRSDPSSVMIAVKNDPVSLQYSDTEIFDNIKIMKYAIKKEITNAYFLSDNLTINSKLIDKIYKKNKDVVSYIKSKYFYVRNFNSRFIDKNIIIYPENTDFKNHQIGKIIHFKDIILSM